MQVHKFSKFIHGCATLMPEDVQAVPYWIDDPTLKDSIIESGAEDILKTSKGANEIYGHLIPHDSSGKSKASIPRSPANGQSVRRKAPDFPTREMASYGSIEHANHENWDEEEGMPDNSCLPSFCLEWANQVPDIMRVSPQKVEPKLLFANERTFMKWLHMAVILSSASTGILAFTTKESE